MKILIIGNCQTRHHQKLLDVAGGFETVVFPFQTATEAELEAALNSHDWVLAQQLPSKYRAFNETVARAPNVLPVPRFWFAGYHPDIAYFSVDGASDPTSRIVLGAFLRGLPVDEAASLFQPGFFEAMGYYDDFGTQVRLLKSAMADFAPDPDGLVEKWIDGGAFCYQPNHPTFATSRDILENVLDRAGLSCLPAAAVGLLSDHLQQLNHYPTLNDPRSDNTLESPDSLFKIRGRIYDRAAYVDLSYRQLAALPKVPQVRPADQARFDAAYDAWRAAAPRPQPNPYRARPPRAFWAASVARPATGEVAPTAQVRPVIGPASKVATAGSCFAQHIARTMVRHGLEYFVAEPAPPGMTEDEAAAQHYGVYSARYGNVYTARQLRQLFEEAFGRRRSKHRAWPAPKGGFIDPLRPNIGQTFDSPEAVEDAREKHLAAVREMFTGLDVFVFTLGLTEGWFDASDGTVFPVAPGVVSPEVDGANIRFVNFGYRETHADMSAFLRALRKVNPGAQVILTVSPVPLIATYSENDALSATTYSKSVLRAVAGDLGEAHEFVQYFPSYEMITGNHARGAYFGDNLRDVRPEGVAHVMRVFMQNVVAQEGGTALAPRAEADPGADARQEYERQQDIICEELLITKNL